MSCRVILRWRGGAGVVRTSGSTERTFPVFRSYSMSCWVTLCRVGAVVFSWVSGSFGIKIISYKTNSNCYCQAFPVKGSMDLPIYHCGEVYHTDSSNIGKRIQCRRCGEIFTIE